MKKVRLTESDLRRIVKRTLNEDDNETYGHKSQDPKQLDLFKSEEGLNVKIDELLKNLKDKFNKHLTSIAYNSTNHIGKEIRLWLKSEIGELDKLSGEIWDQMSANVRSKGGEKYKDLFKELEDELELFYDESKIKVIDELFNSKDKIFKKKRGDKDQLKLDFPKKGGKETVSTLAFSFDKFDSTLEDLYGLENEGEDMLYKMEDLDLTETNEYEELTNLNGNIRYDLQDFQSLYDELSDAYSDFDTAEAEGDEEEVEYLEGYIESLEGESMSIFRSYNGLKQDLDDLFEKINKIIKD